MIAYRSGPASHGEQDLAVSNLLKVRDLLHNPGLSAAEQRELLNGKGQELMDRTNPTMLAGIMKAIRKHGGDLDTVAVIFLPKK